MQIRKIAMLHGLDGSTRATEALAHHDSLRRRDLARLGLFTRVILALGVAFEL